MYCLVGETRSPDLWDPNPAFYQLNYNQIASLYRQLAVRRIFIATSTPTELRIFPLFGISYCAANLTTKNLLNLFVSELPSDQPIQLRFSLNLVQCLRQYQNIKLLRNFNKNI